MAFVFESNYNRFIILSQEFKKFFGTLKAH